MAKFDKNVKNEYLSDDELFDEDYYDEEEDDGGYDDEDEYRDDESEYRDYEDESGTDEPEADELTAVRDEDETASAEAGESAESPENSAEEDDSEAKWYVVHTYSGYENKVKINIEKMVENRGMQDLIRRVVIPTEDVLEETKSGERKVKKSKLFPGYVIVNMVLTSESWYLIRNTNGVTGFVGQGTDPIPLTDEEVRHMGIERTRVKLDLEVGDRVRIIDGAYRDYMLIVDEIDLSKQKVKGRLGQVTMEIPFDLVEKMA